MFGDQQNSVDRKFARAQSEGVGDFRLDRKPMRGGQEPADIVRRLLVREERNELQAANLAPSRRACRSEGAG